MGAFEDGFHFFTNHFGSFEGALMASEYVSNIEKAIETLEKDLESFKGFNSDPSTLKGDVAEFWHADTFNIEAALNESKHKAFVDRSHELASVDVSTNFGVDAGLKYYKTGADSAKQQAKSYLERFNGDEEALKKYFESIGIEDYEKYVNDPIYMGQFRIVPKDQLADAITFLEKKIAKESISRPEQVKRYQETLEKISDRISDGNGIESIPLSKEEAETIALLAKEGNVDLSQWGLTLENLVTYDYVLKEAINAGLSSGIITLVLKIAPSIIGMFETLVKNGSLDKDELKESGLDAIVGSAEGFVRGGVSAAIITACKAGLWGNALKDINPTVIGTVTSIAMDMMRNSYEVVRGSMTSQELSNELIKDMYVAGWSLAIGEIGQVVIEIPIVGYLLGNFVGSILGAFTYDIGYSKVLSFCVDTGFTFFGLVNQDYTLPESVMTELGYSFFDYEGVEYSKVEYTGVNYSSVEYSTVEYDSPYTFIRRGVIGINRIGYVL